MCVDKEEQYKSLNKLPIITEKKKPDQNNSKLFLKEKFADRNGDHTQKILIDNRNTNLTEKAVHKEEKKMKIVKKVTLNDIKKTAYELKLRFIIKRIEISSIEKYLFNEKILSKGSATITELKEILQK